MGVLRRRLHAPLVGESAGGGHADAEVFRQERGVHQDGGELRAVAGGAHPQHVALGVLAQDEGEAALLVGDGRRRDRPPLGIDGADLKPFFGGGFAVHHGDDRSGEGAAAAELAGTRGIQRLRVAEGPVQDEGPGLAFLGAREREIEAPWREHRQPGPGAVGQAARAGSNLDLVGAAGGKAGDEIDGLAVELHGLRERVEAVALGGSALEARAAEDQLGRHALRLPAHRATHLDVRRQLHRPRGGLFDRDGAAAPGRRGVGQLTARGDLEDQVVGLLDVRDAHGAARVAAVTAAVVVRGADVGRLRLEPLQGAPDEGDEGEEAEAAHSLPPGLQLAARPPPVSTCASTHQTPTPRSPIWSGLRSSSGVGSLPNSAETRSSTLWQSARRTGRGCRW